MKKLALGVLAVGLLTFSGCGTRVSYVRMNRPPKRMTPRKADDVDIYMSKRPTRRFVEVAMLEASRRSIYSGANEQRIINRMRLVAAKKGCDGIIITGSADRQAPGVELYQRQTLKGYRAVCIQYR